ncbi:MAG: hypothetical protein KC731_12925 [Myxococcales bacterium]|nr:hypothetical protein [Myxococcales bacterium]
MWSRVAWVLLLSLVGCSAPSRSPAESPSAPPAKATADQNEEPVAASRQEAVAPVAEDWRRYPVGDMFVAWGKTSELGWLDLRARRVVDCGDGLVGVELEARNQGDKAFEGRLLRGHAFLTIGGKEIQAERWAGDPCREQDLFRSLRSAESGTVWLVAEGKAADTTLLSVAVKEPRGLAEHRLIFGLRDGVKSPLSAESSRPVRPPPPKERLGEPVETAYYRVTVIRALPCGASEEARTVDVGIELLIENFSNVPFNVSSAFSLKAADGASFNRSFLHLAGPCATPKIGIGTLEPGERSRGWLSAVRVSADARDLTLEYRVGGYIGGGDHVQIPIGSVPKLPEPLPEERAPTQWHAPKVAKAQVPEAVVTVTNVQPCFSNVQNGKIWLAVEILIENRSPHPIVTSGVFRLNDADAYRYDDAYVNLDDASPCQPRIDATTIKRGGKLRGWTRPFRVPVTAKGLTVDLNLQVEEPPPRGQRFHVPREVSLTVPAGELQRP